MRFPAKRFPLAAFCTLTVKPDAEINRAEVCAMLRRGYARLVG
ncbi:MAG: hypothetical protein SPI98_03290 [Oscillospiraceae bacterium]|nr:hypothetical protein [Oscillospiraceae bacterium]